MAYVPAHYRATTAGYTGGHARSSARGNVRKATPRYAGKVTRHSRPGTNQRVRVRTGSKAGSSSRSRRARSSHSSGRTGHSARLTNMHKLATRQGQKKSITIGQYHLGKYSSSTVVTRFAHPLTITRFFPLQENQLGKGHLEKLNWAHIPCQQKK